MIIMTTLDVPEVVRSAPTSECTAIIMNADVTKNTAKTTSNLRIDGWKLGRTRSAGI